MRANAAAVHIITLALREADASTACDGYAIASGQQVMAEDAREPHAEGICVLETAPIRADAEALVAREVRIHHSHRHGDALLVLVEVPENLAAIRRKILVGVRRYDL